MSFGSWIAKGEYIMDMTITKKPVVIRKPDDLIDTLIRKISDAELSQNPYEFIDIRRILNNELRQTIDVYAEQVKAANG
jgi:hypothetical protein